MFDFFIFLFCGSFFPFSSGVSFLPTDLYYVEEENEVLTLDKWLSLCDRIHMPVPDDRHSGEMIKDYVKSKLANG